VEDAAVVAELSVQGWKQAPDPVTDSNTTLDEHGRRAAGKWETIVRGSAVKRRGGVLTPALTVAIIGRGPWDVDDPKLQAVYAAVLTVSAPKFAGNLYDAVTAQFDKLRPLSLQSRVEAAARLRSFRP
jgi:hypothetical protein